MSIDKKTHLLAVDFPINHWPAEVKTACETEIKDAMMLFCWDNVPVGPWQAEWTRIGTCPECFRKIKETKEEQEIVYGVKSLEAMHRLASDPDAM